MSKGYKTPGTLAFIIEEHFRQEGGDSDAFYRNMRDSLLHPSTGYLKNQLTKAEVNELFKSRLQAAFERHGQPDKKEDEAGYDDIEQEKEGETGRSNASKARSCLSYIRAAVRCGIPIDVFGIETHLIFPFDGAQSKPNYFSFDYDEDMGEKYFSFMKDYLTEDIKELQVYHYFVGSGGVTPRGFEEYFQACGQIYRQIEDRLRRNMTYTRVLGLQIGRQDSNDFKPVSEAILNQCSPELFNHMCICLQEFNSHRVQFHITSKPSRTYQFAILKNTRKVFVYEERYSLDSEGDALPNFATMHRAEEKTGMHFHYDKDISKHTKKKHPMCFSKGTFCDCFRNVAAGWREKGLNAEDGFSMNEFVKTMDSKIDAFNKIFGRDANGKIREGWNDIEPLGMTPKTWG